MEEENKKPKISFKVLIAILMVVVLLAGFAGGYFCYYLINRKYSKFIEILNLIQENGLETKVNDFGEEISQDEIADALVKAVLEDDNYKEYYTAKEYEQLLKERQGRFTGIGVSFGVVRDVNTNEILEDRIINRVIGNSPAMKSGIKQGDIIYEGKTSTSQYIALKSQTEIVDFIKGVPLNSSIYLKVYRDSESLEIELVKKEYVASYITYASNTEKIVFNKGTSNNVVMQGEKLSELADDTAYIKFDEFNGDAAIQFKNALNYAFSKGKDKIILDMRNNGGGKMDVMLDIASYLIYNGGQKKSAITITKFKPYKGKERKETYTTSYNNYPKGKLSKIVVLANHNTASASECLLNAMLYYGSANKDNNFTKENNLIITKEGGVAKTFGKGIMQTTFELRTGGAVKLTTAKLYAPNGSNCIHKIGFTTTEQNSVENSMALSRAVELLA